MDLVLGLSLTSSTVRWVLVEGVRGEGATVDRGALDFDAAVNPDDLLEVVLADVVETLHAIGVTWTIEAEQTASGVLEALAARGYGDSIAVSELDATEMLTAGLAEIADYGDVAVCVVEPDAAVVAMVDAAGVTVDRIARPLDGADVIELPSSVITLLELNEWEPEAIFVVGSAGDLELVQFTLEAVSAAPVFSATEADLALARGAALASARAVNALDAPGPGLPLRVGALASVLVAAVVTFVVSLSAAVGLTLTGGEQAPQHSPGAVEEPVADQDSGPPVTVADKPTTPAEAMPVVAETIAAVAPPPPAAPVAESYDPPAYVPPAPAYVPPAPEYVPPAPEPVYSPPPPVYSPPPPAHVPPARAPAYTAPAPNYVPPVAPQPRLRDRIIERIPIINRFHEPDYSYFPR